MGRRSIWIRPSTANLWAAPGGCWASATFEPPADRGDTEHTERGTRLHAAVASIIRPHDPDHPKPVLEDGEWGIAQRAVAELEEHVAVDQYDWTVEKTVGWPMGDGESEETMTHLEGTPDLVGRVRRSWWRERGKLMDGPRMVIVDWKFGKFPVPAEGNHQLLVYAVLLTLGSGFDPSWYAGWQDTDEIRVMIVQPANADIHQPVVSKAILTFREVREAGERLDALAVRMLTGDLTYNPSAANCRWCEGSRSLMCPQVLGSMQEAETVRVGADRRIPSYLYEDFLAKADLVAEMARHIREAARQELIAGRPVPGLKLVPGRASPRRWADEVAAGKALADLGDHHARGVDIYTEPRLRTVSALDREFRRVGATLSRDVLRAHTAPVSAPDPVVAYEDDRRPTLGEKRIADAIAHYTKPTEDSNGKG